MPIAGTKPARPSQLALQVIIAIASIIAILILIAALYILVPMWQERAIRFESSEWKSTPATFSHTSIRQRMVDDLLRSHPLLGNTRPEVESLLGPADNTGYFSEYDMVYHLGQERHSYIAIDSEWLVIRLDSTGKVSQTRLVTD